MAPATATAITMATAATAAVGTPPCLRQDHPGRLRGAAGAVQVVMQLLLVLLLAVVVAVAVVPLQQQMQRGQRWRGEGRSPVGGKSTR
jgi:hypothetical protein